MNYFDATFHLPKSEMTKEDLRFNLRVSSNKGFRGSILKVDCWEDGGDFWDIPLAWALSNGYIGEDRTPRISKKWPKIDLSYRHNQKEVIESVIPHLKKHRCSRIKAQTGWGKSVAAVDIARRLDTNALIVVPTNEILKQFKITCKDIFGIKFGLIKGETANYKELVTLTTYQTLSRRCSEDQEYFDKFGLFVLDEAHLSGCPSFKSILHRVNATWRLSVSADFYRADKLEGVYPLYLGDLASEGKKDPSTTMEKVVWSPGLPTDFKISKCYDRFGEFSQVSYLTELANDVAYNRNLAYIIKEILEKGGRRILVGLKRLTQADILEDLLGRRLCGKFTGVMKEDELAKSATKKVILYTKSDLGFDVSKFLGEEVEKKLDPLNTVIVGYPTNNSLQLIGRGARENRGKIGLIIHPRTNDFYSRATYKKCFEKNYKELRQISDLKELNE